MLELAPGCKGQPLKGRLKHVEATAHSHTEKPDPEFDALSYCWGDDATTESILIGGTSLNITANLYDALQHLRSEDVSQNLWVDQVCINQKDIIERDQQVQQMDVIYAGARKVVAWLGSATTESRVILGGLCKVDDEAWKGQLIDESKPYFTKERQGRGTVWISICAELRAAVLRHHPELENTDDWSENLAWDFCVLLQNPWFKRMWIVQEAALPRRLFFQSGRDRLSWWKLFAVLSDAEFSAQTGHLEILWVLRMTQLRAQIIDNGMLDFTLGSLVSMFRDQKSADPRDKVYALVGLVSRMLQNFGEVMGPLKVDYSKSAARVFTDLVIWEVEAYQDIRSVSRCCSQRLCSLQGLTSWTVEWSQGLLEHSCSPLRGGHPVPRTAYKASGNHRAQAQYVAAKEALFVTGLTFDVIDETTIGPPTTFNDEDPGPRRQPGIESSNTSCSLSLEWKSLALKSTPVDPYGAPGGRVEAFCRTLITDYAHRPVSSDVVQAFVSLWDGAEVDFGDVVRSGGRSPRTKCLNFEDWLHEFISEATLHRKLFRTRRGYLGISCHHIKKSDKVCILWGGELPFILRESGSLDVPEAAEQEDETSTRQVISHELIGGYCYIYGLAGGEGIEIAEK